MVVALERKLAKGLPARRRPAVVAALGLPAAAVGLEDPAVVLLGWHHELSAPADLPDGHGHADAPARAALIPIHCAGITI